MSKKIPATEKQFRAAQRREQLATERYKKWARQYQKMMDRADTRKSKSWRSRDIKAAMDAARRAEIAERDIFIWRDRREKYAELERRRKRKTDQQRRRRAAKKPGRKKAPAGGWEYVLKVQYKSGKKGHKVWWDVRLKKDSGARATKKELQKAVNAIRRGEIPDGWGVENIAWDIGQRPGWGAEPAREPSSSEQAEAALAALSSTLGYTEGKDYSIKGIEVGEEEME